MGDWNDLVKYCPSEFLRMGLPGIHGARFSCFFIVFSKFSLRISSSGTVLNALATSVTRC